MINKKFGVRFFSFCDDNFIGPGGSGRRRAVEIAAELLSRKLKIEFEIFCRSDNVDAEVIKRLKKAGLTGVFLGVESGVQRILDTFNKKTTVLQNEQAMQTLLEAKLNVVIGYIFFDPYLTPEEIRINARYIRKMLKKPIDYYPSNPLSHLIPFSGTALLEQLRKDRLLTGNYKGGYFFKFLDRRVEEVFNLLKTLQAVQETSCAGISPGRTLERIKSRSLALQLAFLEASGRFLSESKHAGVQDMVSTTQGEKLLFQLLHVGRPRVTSEQQ
jgi:radical SAM superfamily enzyme YgiQ (UPF0313 family)